MTAVAQRHRRPPPARTEMPVADLAWMAGVLDLKALLIRKRNATRNTPQMVLVVESKRVEVVRGLSRMTGTRPELQEEKNPETWMRKGCTDHCPEAHVHVNERGYEWKLPAVSRWTITGAAAAVVLYNVLPYMRNPRDFPEVAEEMLRYTVTRGQGWGATRAALQRLMKLGWRLPPPLEELV